MNSDSSKLLWAGKTDEQRDELIFDALCDGDGPTVRCADWGVSKRVVIAHMATDRFRAAVQPIREMTEKASIVRAQFLKPSIILGADAKDGGKVDLENLYTVSRYAMAPTPGDDDKIEFTDEDRNAAINMVKSQMFKIVNSGE